MAYTDKTLTCIRCKKTFVCTVKDQELRASEGRVGDPQFCGPCYQARKAEVAAKPVESESEKAEREARQAERQSRQAERQASKADSETGKAEHQGRDRAQHPDKNT
jgi:hypothetical protein